MRVLLDTHAFLWWVEDDPRLSLAARDAITGAAEGLLSIASCWELAIKVGRGRLTLSRPIEKLGEVLGASELALIDPARRASSRRR